ncbi:hypothetical protein Emed_006403 [Eimeria media]
MHTQVNRLTDGYNACFVALVLEELGFKDWGRDLGSSSSGNNNNSSTRQEVATATAATGQRSAATTTAAAATAAKAATAIAAAAAYLKEAEEKHDQQQQAWAGARLSPRVDASSSPSSRSKICSHSNEIVKFTRGGVQTPATASTHPPPLIEVNVQQRQSSGLTTF